MLSKSFARCFLVWFVSGSYPSYPPVETKRSMRIQSKAGAVQSAISVPQLASNTPELTWLIPTDSDRWDGKPIYQVLPLKACSFHFLKVSQSISKSCESTCNIVDCHLIANHNDLGDRLLWSKPISCRTLLALAAVWWMVASKNLFFTNSKASSNPCQWRQIPSPAHQIVAITVTG